MGGHKISEIANGYSIFKPLGAQRPCHRLDARNVVSRSCIVAGVQESLTYKYGDHRWLWTASAHYDMWGKWLHNVNTVEQSPATNGWQDRWCPY